MDYEDEYKDGKVEVNIIASEPEELIRCKDCKHMKYTQGKKGICAALGALIIMNENDYCSCGERKEDDER